MRRHAPDAHVGPPVGHEGHGVSRKPAEIIVVRAVCPCGRKKMPRLDKICKIIIGYAGDARRLAYACVQLEARYCYKRHLVVEAPDPNVKGTSLIKELAADVVGIYGDGPTARTVVKMLRTMVGEKLAENTIRNCARAVAENCLETSMEEILEALRRAAWIQIDEATMPMMDGRGYVWLVRTDEVTFIVATPSRSEQVVHTFFDCLIGKYATADGYIVHKKLFKVQRCWSHELNIAKDLAIRGGVGSLHDKLFDELRGIYYAASVLGIRGGATEEQIRGLKDELRVAIAQYGDHPFAGRLDRALDDLFTALRVPGMCLTNNPTESDIRKVVVYRNLHHQFKTARGMRVFSILHSYVQTAEKNGHLPAAAVLARMNDPDWSLFGDSADGNAAGRKPKCYPPTPKQLATLKRKGARIGTASRALVLAEPAYPVLAEPAEPAPAEPRDVVLAEPAEPAPAEPRDVVLAEPAEPAPAEPRDVVLAEPAEHDSAATGLDAAQSSAVPETLAADAAEGPHACAHYPQRANRFPEPVRTPARIPVAAALALECFCRCILHAMFSTFTEAACRQVAAHAAVSLGTVPRARVPQPPPTGPARRHATSASAAARHQRDGP